MGFDSRVLRAAVGVLVVALAGALLVRVFAGLDVRAVAATLMSAGRFAPLAVVPFFAGMAADAWGIQRIAGALGRRVPFAKVLPIRVATEALHMTAPAGFVVADTATAALLEGQASVPLGEGAVVVVARKWLVTRAHAIYIALGALLGGGALAVISEKYLSRPWMGAAFAAGLALVPLALSKALGLGFEGNDALSSLLRFAERIPSRWLRERIRRAAAGAARGDALMARVGSARGATRWATVAFCVCWLTEALETALLLWMLGGPFDLRVALAIETGASLIRSIGNVAPAGLGLQEAGYATLLTATGTGVDAAAAFVLLKRCKELLWIGAGYGLLATMRRARRPFASAPGGAVPA